MNRKAELLYKLIYLTGLKRKMLTEHHFLRFIRAYLDHATTHAMPDFHGEMIQLMGKMATAGGVLRGQAGGEAPTAGSAPERTSPTNFSDKISKAALTDEAIYRLLFIAPRGFAKSTLCSQFFPLWLAVFAKKKDIFLVSATISLAREMLRKVKNELETNKRILRDFGNLRGPDKWTEDALFLSNGVKIRAKGRGFQIRGFRPDMIICDDLEDEEIIYSKEQREKLEHWFFRTLLPALKPDQTLMYVGTMIHQFSLMAKLRQKEEFQVRFYKALTDGRSIWEDLWPTERLLKLRKELGTYAFEAEYQNNPISLSEQPVKPHMLEKVEVAGALSVLCLSVDPAISEKQSSDERAFVLLGKFVDEDGSPTGFKELYSEKGRWGVTEQIQKIIDTYRNYSEIHKGIPFRVVVESVAFQKVFKDDLIREARKQKIFIPVDEAELGMGDNKIPKDKFTRLLQIVHVFEQRLVQLVNPDLIEEILAFPLGDADNMVDACVYSLYWLIHFRTGAATFRKLNKKLPVESRQSYVVREVRPGVYVTDTAGDPPLPRNSRIINFDK